MFAEMIYKISTPRNKLHKYVDSNSHVPFEASILPPTYFDPDIRACFVDSPESERGFYWLSSAAHCGLIWPAPVLRTQQYFSPAVEAVRHYFNCGWTQTSSLRQNSPRVPVARLFGRLRNPGGSWCVYAGAERLTQCCYWWRVTLMHTWSGSCASGRALKGNRAAPLKSRCRGPFGAPLCKKPSGNADRTNTHTHPFDSQNHLSTNSPCNEIMPWFSHCMIFLEHKRLGTIHYNSNYFKGIV